MPESNGTALGHLLDAEDKLNEADSLAELIRLAGMGEKTAEAKAMGHGAYLIIDALQEALGFIAEAKKHLLQGEAA